MAPTEKKVRDAIKQVDICLMFKKNLNIGLCVCILCVCRQRGCRLKYFCELIIQRKIITLMFKMYVITYN